MLDLKSYLLGGTSLSMIAEPIMVKEPGMGMYLDTDPLEMDLGFVE
jgi:hypothetical protein